MQVYFICDESGAKGRALVGEQYLGEVGVIAGLFVDDKMFDQLDSWSEQIKSKYFVHGKAHISNLIPRRQEALRVEVFNFIKEHHIICAYEAIHAKGFRQQHLSLLEIYKKLEALSRSPNIFGRDCAQPRSLHEELFTGIFCKAGEFFNDNYECNRDELEILVDRVDSDVLESFRRVARELTDLSPRMHEFKHRDPDPEKRISKRIIENFDGLDLPFIEKFKNRYQINVGEQHLTMLADVLANSIYHHFKSRSADQLGNPLLDRAAIKGHFLAEHFYGVSHDLDAEEWSISDRFYQRTAD